MIAEGRLAILEHCCLGDLEFEAAGRQTGTSEGIENSQWQGRIFELDRREIDRHTHSNWASSQLPLHACCSTQSPSEMIRPVSSATGMNSAGRDRTFGGVVPAKERLAGRDFPGLEVRRAAERAPPARRASILPPEGPSPWRAAPERHRPSLSRRSETCLGPPAFAEYSAMSARFSSSSASIGVATVPEQSRPTLLSRPDAPRHRTKDSLLR